jgi:hypothetical protein
MVDIGRGQRPRSCGEAVMSRGLRTLRRLVARVAAVTLATTLLAAVPGAARAAAVYDQQLSSPAGLFLVNGPDHAAAQQFVTAHTQVSTLSAYVVNNSPVGTLDAQIRTDVTDPASAITDSRIDLARLGGSGAGWVKFPVNVAVTAGRTYYLVVQAIGVSDKVVWNGVQGAVPGALPSWNYDVAYWGGWKAYDAGGLGNSHLAFGIDLSGAGDCAATNTCYKSVPAGDLLAYTAGLLGTGQTTVAVSPLQAYGASYVPDSNVLRLPDGRWRYLPEGAGQPVTVPAGDPGARAQIARSRAWLAAGTVPGRTVREKAAAARALLSLRLLTRPNGAVAAAWYGAWAYSWPRDSAFVAVAFARTGHLVEAYKILTYNARTQRADGTWEARTTLDGAGPPDGRHWQLDANGWVPWAVWQWYEAAPRKHREQLLAALYPTVQKAAGHAAASLDSRGLPPASPDYWEIGTTTPNIGTAAPLLAGLHASADLARRTGRPSDTRAWNDAARRLTAGIDQYFAPAGYPRSVDGLHGRDSAVTFMAPPYNHAPPRLAAAIDSTYQALVRPNGGVIPGDDPGQQWANTWTPETAFFALAWSATGQRQKADRVVNWLLEHRNMLGELPEQINAAGNPVSVVPLGWTGALTVLTLCQLGGHQVPTPPAPCRLRC